MRIYIYKEECLCVCLSVCLFVRYAFKNRTCKCNQTFHDISLGPEEGRHGVGIEYCGSKNYPEPEPEPWFRFGFGY
jgi:hypothetical protein